jgi:putative copper export protein
MVERLADSPSVHPADEAVSPAVASGPVQRDGEFLPAVASGPIERNRIISARGVIISVLAAGITAVLYALWWIGSDAPVLDGIPDQGTVTNIGLPIAQYVSEIAGVIVVGLLFVRCLSPGEQATPGHRHLGRMAARWGVVWAAGTAVWIVFTLSDLIGVPVTGLPARAEFIVIALDTTRVLAEIATFWVALLVAMFATRTARPVTNGLLMVAAAAALLPAALTGHSSHHNSPAIATVALGVHIVAASIWVGGLLALIVHLRPFPDQLGRAVRRFSTAALICVVAVGLSGVVAGYVMLDGPRALFGTSRGQLILAKSLALVVLCAIGYQHRQRTVGAAGSGRLGPLLRLGAGELAMMGATVGLAVVLSTTA